MVRGMRRAIPTPPQGHFSPSSTTSPQIHGPREVTGNLMGFKTATCPESARCLSRQGRESKMFTGSGDAATAEQGRQAELPGTSRPCWGETTGIPDMPLEIPSSASASPQKLFGTGGWDSGKPSAPHDLLLQQSPGVGGSPGLQRSLTVMLEKGLQCFLPWCPSLLPVGEDQPVLFPSC